MENQEGCEKGKCCSSCCGAKALMAVVLLLIGGIGGYVLGRCGVIGKMICRGPAALSTPANPSGK